MSKYVVTVHEIIADPTGATIATAEVFKQSVDAIDLPRVFAAVNFKPRVRKPRVAKPSAS